jgi:RNA 3'-terminal phosphate cyclase (ATP)
VILLAEFAGSRACYSALGARGKPAECVADEAVDGLEEFLATDGAIDQYLADQLILPMALISADIHHLADKNSTEIPQFRTSRVTQHLLTNIEVIRAFLPVEIEVDGALGTPGTVIVRRK